MPSEMPSRAVIGGLACRLPKSRNAQEFWENLSTGKDMTGPTRWPPKLYGLPGCIGAIPDLDKFDNKHFSIPDDQVKEMNPLLSHLLEVSYECWVDSCLPLETLRDEKIGLYLGCCHSDTDCIETSPCQDKSNATNSPYLASELVKYLRITGPSVTVDAAGSSSMAALQNAVRDLQSGYCDYAFVAGCDLILNPNITKQMFELDMLSQDGKTRVFDAQASGFVRAEGVVVLLLGSDPSRLAHVYCNVVDIGVNFLGTGSILDRDKTTEQQRQMIEKQADLIHNLYDRRGLDISQVQYIEANGSANKSEDIVEATALEKVFCGQRKEPLLIGSVTSNMGHSEATAGLAAIVKCILAMHHGELPCNLNFDTPNSEIPGLVNGHLQVVTKPTKLTGKYIGVNSLGSGGVHSHVILQSYQRQETEDFEQIGGHMVIPMTVGSRTGVSNVVDFVNNNRYNNSLLSILSQSQLSCDSSQPIRGYIQIGPQEDDVHVSWHTWDKDEPEVSICLDDFVGSMIGVTPDLLEVDCFMNALNRCESYVRMFDPDLDLFAVLRSKEPLLSITRVGMVAAGVILICLGECLEHAGMDQPVQLLGCGLSEIAAAYMEGCLNLDQCLLAYNCIGKHLEQFAQQAVDRWQVYDVRLDIEQVYRLGPWVQVLNIQDSDHVTISLETKYKHKVLSKIHQKGGFYNIIPSNIPVYSGYMREVAQKIKQDLKDVIPSPRYRSCRLQNCRLPNLSSSKPDTWRQLFDTDYISRIICESVCQYIPDRKHSKPQDDNILRVRLIPTSTTTLLHKLQEPGDLDFTGAADLSNISQNQSMCSDALPRTQTGLRCVSVSTQSELDETVDAGEYLLSGTHNAVTCMASTRSLCHTLGELHMNGLEINVNMVYRITNEPLGIETPCLSPLVAWQHDVAHSIPPWMAFSFTVKDEDKAAVYFPWDREVDETHSPLAVLLYHCWCAVARKMSRGEIDEVPVKLHHLDVADDSVLTVDNIMEAVIEVMPGTKTFVASFHSDTILMKGKFDIQDTFSLPSIPGYDLDINENIKLDQDSFVQCEKSEINWEDNWLEFLNDFVELASLYLKNASDTLELVVDPVQHHAEAKECPKFLAVVENTGVCRSGGCALLFNTPLIDPESDAILGKIIIDKPRATMINHALVYGIHAHRSVDEQLILYQAEKSEGSSASVIGLVNLKGDELMREFPLPEEWEDEHMEILVPFILASYLLFDVGRVKIGQTVLILSPIDTVSVYLIWLANQFGCSVFASTYDTENLQCLEAMFPNVRVLPADGLHSDLMTLTQGQGVKLCLRVASGDLSSALECLSDNGQLIQCIPPDSGIPNLTSGFSSNIRISLVRPLDAFTTFMKKSQEDISVLMFNIRDISKLSTEGFPEKKGILYRQENSSSFMQPISVDKMLSVVMEPNLGVSMETFVESDALCLEKIQDLVAAKPKDYSLMEPVEKNVLMGNSGDLLNLGMIATPFVAMETNVASEGSISPEVNIISMLDLTKELSFSPLKSKISQDLPKVRLPPTSTPMGDEIQDGVHGNKQLEESYLEQGKREATTFNDSVPDENEGQTITADQKEGRPEDTGDHCDGSMASKGIQKTASAGSNLLLANPKDQATKAIRPVPDIQVYTGTQIHTDVPSVRPPYLSTPVPLSWSASGREFRSHMEQKLKPVPPKLKLPKRQLDLLQLCPPLTPMTPALKEVLTPLLVPNLVPLNHLRNDIGKPLYIVHPASGVTWMLEKLGTRLCIPCYGIQRTGSTPSDSVHSVASYYRNAIEMMQPSGPYRIGGYDFGTMIALEIALQLQAEGKKVDQLLMLDGSPTYVQAQNLLPLTMKLVPTSATKAQMEEALEVGALLKWISKYRDIPNMDLTCRVLWKLNSQAERLNTAVDFTSGDVVVSSSPSKTRWLKAGRKIMNKRMENTSRAENFASVAKEIVRIKRRDKARDFLIHMKMAQTYMPGAPYQGDVHLHRIKSSPVFTSPGLPTDYGLHNHCTGKVHVQLYDGDHETFLTSAALPSLVKNIHQGLGIKETKKDN